MDRITEEGLTFDDVLLAPGYSEVLPHEANLKTFGARRLPLQIPIISAAMDTVTESGLAIALAREGGVGIIHKNMAIAKQSQSVHIFMSTSTHTTVCECTHTTVCECIHTNV